MLFSFFLASFSLAASIIQVQIPADPATLDPYQVSDVTGYNIASNIYQGLVKLNGKGELVPALAEKYEVSKDGKKYTFYLKTKLKWSDGKELTSEHFAKGIELALNPSQMARDGNLLWDSKLAKGKSPKITAQKDKLVIELPEYIPSFIYALAMPMAAPVRPDFLVSGKYQWRQNLPSSGPYFLAQWKVDSQLKLSINSFHPSPGKREFLFKVISDETTACNLFETKDINIVQSISPLEISRFTPFLKKYPSASSFFLAINMQKELGMDKNSRHLISQSIDRASLAKILPHILKPTESFLPQSIPGADAKLKKEEVKGLKYLGGKKDSLTITYANSATANLVMQRIQNELGSKLKIKVNLEPMEWKSFLAKASSGEAEAFYMGYSAPFPEPISHFKILRSQDPENKTAYANATFDQKVKEYGNTPDPKKRAKAAREAHAQVLEDLPVIPLLEREQIFLVNDGVKNLQVNPFGIMNLPEVD